jgi:DNA-binding MarR family transcriptional regulator
MENIDKLIHSNTRLAIITYLYKNKKATFNELKEILKITDGNLSVNLSKLEMADYIRIEKMFKGKIPLTICYITKKGEEAFINYINELEKIIKEIKRGD